MYSLIYTSEREKQLVLSIIRIDDALYPNCHIVDRISHYLSHQDHILIVKQMILNYIATGGDIDYVTKEGNTLLLLSVKHNNISIFDFLMQFNPIVSYFKPMHDHCMYYAILNANTKIVHTLMNYDPDWNIKLLNNLSPCDFAYDQIVKQKLQGEHYGNLIDIFGMLH